MKQRWLASSHNERQEEEKDEKNYTHALKRIVIFRNQSKQQLFATLKGSTPTSDGSDVDVHVLLPLKWNITNMSCITNMAFVISATKTVVDTIVCSKVRWKNIAISTLLILKKNGSCAGKEVGVRSLILPNVQEMLMRKPTLPRIGPVKQCLKMAQPLHRSVCLVYTWYNTCKDCTAQVGTASVGKLQVAIYQVRP